MKKLNNIFSEDFTDFKPKKSKIKNTKSKQVSFYELDFEDNYNKSTKKKFKHVNYN
jgi:hypothetical protein